MDRRALLVAGLGGAAVLRPAAATPESLLAAVQAFTNGGDVQDGRVTLDMATLVDNGNAVPVSVVVQSPMTEADHVRHIALFTQRNPQSDVAVFHLGPHNGAARVATRMRLATSQTVVAIAAMSDGTFWQQRVEVVVSIAACIES